MIITWPGLPVKESGFSQIRNDISFSSMFGSQSNEIATPVWGITLEATPGLEMYSGDWKVIGIKLAGKTNQLAVWDIARPVPLGTMRGTMTLNSSAAQGATTLSIVATGQNAKTLLKADYLGIGANLTQQVVMVMDRATSNGSGIIEVTVQPPLRNAFAAGESITWNQPKALFRRVDSKYGWKNFAAQASGFVLDLQEDWRI